MEIGAVLSFVQGNQILDERPRKGKKGGNIGLGANQKARAFQQ